MAKTRGFALLLALVVGSCLVAAYDVVCYLRDADPVNPFSIYWPVLFSVLLALWIAEDSKGRSNIYRPFEFSFLVYFWSLFYLPYYLWRTRGRGGIVAAAAILPLAFLGPLIVWVMYVAG
jgi:hypothetical protein